MYNNYNLSIYLYQYMQLTLIIHYTIKILIMNNIPTYNLDVNILLVV